VFVVTCCLPAVRIHDHTGRFYNVTDLRVSLSEPMREPHSEGKLKLLLSQTVRQSEGTVDLEMSDQSRNVEIAGESCLCYIVSGHFCVEQSFNDLSF